MAATVIGSGITIEGEVSSSEEVVVAGMLRDMVLPLKSSDVAVPE